MHSQLLESHSQTHGEFGKNGMVVTAHPLASEIGLEILQKGGNAYDAAIAVQFALAVVYPRAGNLGGGGFMVTRSKDGEYASLDYREKAPLKATTDMYLDKDGNLIPDAIKIGYLAIGVPRTVAGMYEDHQKYGKFDWKELVAPAVELAQNGFKITESEANILNAFQDDFKEYTSANENPWINENGWKEGDFIQLPELA